MRLFIEEAGVPVELEGATALAGAPGFDFTTVAGGANLSMDPSSVESPPEMSGKYDAVLAGGSGTAHGEAYEFDAVWNGASGYGKYGTVVVSGVSPVEGNIALLTDECVQVGLFDDGNGPGGDPGEGRGEPLYNAGLHIMNTCAPCVDCDDYWELEGYMASVRNALDALAVHFSSEPDAAWTPGSDLSFGLFRQHHALLYYWNYLAYQTTMRLELVLDDSSYPGKLTILASHKNWSTSPINPVCSIALRKYNGSEWEDVDLSSSLVRSRFFPVSAFVGDPPTALGGAESLTVSPNLAPYLTWETTVERDVGALAKGEMFEATMEWTGTFFGGTVSQSKKVYAFENVTDPE